MGNNMVNNTGNTMRNTVSVTFEILKRILIGIKDGIDCISGKNPVCIEKWIYWSEKITRALGNNPLTLFVVKYVDLLYSRTILNEEFTSNEEYVKNFFKYFYFMCMYVFTLVVLNLRRTDVIGIGFVSLLNIFAFFMLSTDLSKYMGPVFIAPFIFVYFPWLVLAACSGLLLYIVGQLKWEYGKRKSTIIFQDHEKVVYKRVKQMFTAATVMMFCLSAIFMFMRTSPFARLFMVLMVLAFIPLCIVILVDSVHLFKKDIRNIYIPTEPKPEEPDFADKLIDVFKNINMNFLMNHDVDLKL
jgi:hypothetical protein